MTDTTVTARAIKRVLIEVETYACTVNSDMKFSSVKPGITFDVKGSTNQNAVINNRNSEKIYTPTIQNIGRAMRPNNLNLACLYRYEEIGLVPTFVVTALISTYFYV